MTLSASTKIKRNPKATFHIDGNNLYILDEKNDELITLNETGLFIWEKLSSTTTIEAIAKSVTLIYSTSLETARNDIEKIVSMLFQRKLILKNQ